MASSILHLKWLKATALWGLLVKAALMRLATLVGLSAGRGLLTRATPMLLSQKRTFTSKAIVPFPNPEFELIYPEAVCLFVGECV